MKWGPLEFLVGDKVHLRVSPLKGVIGFGIGFGKGSKLNVRHIRPFEVLEHVGDLTYHLAFFLTLDIIHNVFHVFQL